MSDGDEEPEESAEEADDGTPDLGVEELEARLDDAAGQLAAAGTEADLDDVEATLDDVEADLEAADLPEPDEDEEAEDPREALESRLSELRDELEAERGPYAEDVTGPVEDAAGTITDTRWTEDGRAALVGAVEAFVDATNRELDAGATVDGEAPEALAAALESAAEAVEAADLDPDDDAGTLAALAEAAETLAAAVADAEEWDDLSIRQQLRAEGFYDVLGKHKDFPPEWSALKEWEKRDDVEMVLLLLDRMGDQGFMERHCLDSLKRMGNAGALDEMLARAEKRDKRAIEILGKIGDDAAVDTILEYVDTESDPALQRATLKALGEIGSHEATRAVANQLAVENESVRSHAARALGLLGDARAVDPLADALADENESDNVRASAAWALVRIGTERALEAAAAYADDPSYLVGTEAGAAETALSTGATA